MQYPPSVDIQADKMCVSPDRMMIWVKYFHSNFPLVIVKGYLFKDILDNAAVIDHYATMIAKAWTLYQQDPDNFLDDVSMVMVNSRTHTATHPARIYGPMVEWFASAARNVKQHQALATGSKLNQHGASVVTLQQTLSRSRH